MILRWGDYPGLSRWALCTHKGPYKRTARGSEWEKGAVTTEAEVRIMNLKMEEWAS